MGFWKKAFVFVFCFAVFIVLQCYAKSIGFIELTCFKTNISLDIYIILSGITFALFLIFILKSFIKKTLYLFSRKKSNIENNSIESIAKLILSDNFDFAKDIDNIDILDKHKILKTALILSRHKNHDQNLELTKVPLVDMHIIKSQLKHFVDTGNNIKAIDLALGAIKKYPKHIKIAQDELLQTAIIAKKNNIIFSFDPSRYKYSLSNMFIENYLLTLSMLEFELAESDDLKLKTLEKIYKNNTNNSEIAIKLLDFAFEKYSEKKILEILENSFKLNPNRKFANILLKLKRQDIFELAQEITSKTPENNLEKLWLLLNIANKFDFTAKTRDLILKIIELDSSTDIINFYLKNLSKFSNDQEIQKAFKRRLK